VKIIFVEFLWQVEEILKDKEKFRNDVIISLDKETSYFLMRNKIKYFETYEFCNHEQLWERYQDITKQSFWQGGFNTIKNRIDELKELTK